MTLAALPDRWREDAAALRRRMDARGAELMEQLADELDAALLEIASEPVTPAEAEAEGICDAETARRAVREGRAENVGTSGRIKVPRLQLPRGRGRKRSGAASFGEIAMEAIQSRPRRI